MNCRRRTVFWLLTVAFCLGLFLVPSSAADLYFTAINDNVQPLTADTMPTWSGGVLYVPYTVFDYNSNGGHRLGFDVSYSRSSNSVALYTINKILVFDLNTGVCRDDLTQETYSGQSFVRNGLPYLSVNMVCKFFGLEYSYTSIPFISQGYLVRIKNDAVVLSDTRFIDAAGDLINKRLRDYNRSIAPPSDTTTPNPSTAAPSSPSDSDAASPHVSTYLAFRCETGDSLSPILDTLGDQGKYAVFFLSPQALEQEPDLVRRILGSGHSVGLLAQGEDTVQTQNILSEGSRLLKEQSYTRTTLALVPAEQRADLEQEGWVCWNETLSLAPTSTVGPNTFASNTLRRLSGRTRSTYLTLNGDTDTARILSALLRQLDSKNFVVNIPMETKL